MADSSQNLVSTKFRVSACFHRLKINKNFSHNTKILWKRHQAKAQTKLVAHAHGFSVYNDTLTLEFSIVFDSSKGIYLQKNVSLNNYQTHFPVIMMDSVVKSGGYAKFDLAQPLNDQLARPSQAVQTTKTIPLTKCPDPQAYVQVTFKYQRIDEDSNSVNVSVLNASSRDFNLSRMDFSEDHKASNELVHMTGTIQKFEELALLVKNRKQKYISEAPEMNKRIEILQGENTQLKRTITNLQDKIKQIEQEAKAEKRELEKQNRQLQKTLERKNKQLREAQNSARDNDYESMYRDLKQKYENDMQSFQDTIDELKQRLQQAEEGKKTPFSTNEFFGKGEFESHQFDKDMGGQRRSSISQQFGRNEDTLTIVRLNAKIKQLQSDQIELQNQVALCSNRVAQLFNAAFDVGGAKLLDQLQKAIGLIEN